MARYPRFVLCLLALSLVGCGGGGSSPGTGTRSAPLSVFATDSPQDAYDHVWTTIHKVELVSSNGQFQTVYSDDVGTTVDLKSLHDATGSRFVFLTNATANATTHADVRVTIDNTLTLFPVGSMAGQILPVADTLPRDAQGRVILTLHLGTPRDLTANATFVMDFDLTDFTVTGGKVTPALKESSAPGLQDATRHEEHGYHGTVSDLSGTAPNQTFTLTVGHDQTFTVITTVDTALFNSDNSPNPVLANDRVVDVHGHFDVHMHHLTATSVQIDVHGEHEHHGHVAVEGVPSTVDATAHTFQVSTHDVEGFTPAQATVLVKIDSNTILRDTNGALVSLDAFFAALPSAAMVEVEGTYDAASNTLTATNAHLGHHSDHGGGEHGNDHGGDHHQ